MRFVLSLENIILFCNLQLSHIILYRVLKSSVLTEFTILKKKKVINLNIFKFGPDFLVYFFCASYWHVTMPCQRAPPSLAVWFMLMRQR